MSKKIILASVIIFVGILIVLVGAVSLNSKFATASFIGSEMSSNIDGRVRYSREGNCLTGQFNAKGFAPGKNYNLVIYSREGDERIAQACGNPGIDCGYQGEESFLITGTAATAKNGVINEKIEECRLPVGSYNDIQFMIIDSQTNEKAWTWENSPDTDLDKMLCPLYSSGTMTYTAGNPWCGDISAFTII